MAPAPCYNNFMKQHFLQSTAWEQYQSLEGKTTFRLRGIDYDILAILESTPLGNYLFCPYGPTLQSPTPANLQHALKALTKLAQTKQAIFVRLEPTFSLTQSSAPHANSSFPFPELEKLGLKKSHDIDPAHTWVLDLTEPESTIFANMEKEKARLWRNHQKKGIKIIKTKDPTKITILTSLLKSVGSRNHFTPQAQTHLENQLKSGFATLYIAELEDPSTQQTVPIAASLVYDYDQVRYYAHAAADMEHRKLVAGTILLVQMIVDAKNAGTKLFDFWGITTSTDPNHPWYGFTKYKKSFGGRQVDYAGTWDLPLHPVRYRLYQALRATNRLRRKLHH